MDVAIIGPGRLGTLLATSLTRAGHRVRAVAGGDADARGRLTALVAGVRAVDELPEAAALARLLVLSIPDAAIEPVLRTLAAADAFRDGHRVVHVSGAKGLDVLRLASRAGAQVGACHPAMTVPTGRHDPDLLVGVAWAVNASPASLPWVEDLVRGLGGDPIVVPDDRRALYHAGLTMGSNAVAAAATLARQLLLAASVQRPEAFLGPLAARSLDNALERGASALTGPIVRGDVGTVADHLAAIERDTAPLADAYRGHSTAILALLRPHLAPDDVAALDRLLAPHAGDR